MSEIQRLEELNYDTEEELRNVLRQEAYDPYEFEVRCELHDIYFQLPVGCEECPAEEPEVILGPFLEDTLMF